MAIAVIANHLPYLPRAMRQERTGGKYLPVAQIPHNAQTPIAIQPRWMRT
jgi:hypothetical protein